MKIIFSLFVVVIFAISCSSPDLYGEIDLGDHYFLLEKNRFLHYIVWSNRKHADGGVLVSGLDRVIKKYNYDLTYIILETVQPKDSRHEFWIIDKRVPINFNVKDWPTKLMTGPFDSIHFVNYLAQKKLT